MIKKQKIKVIVIKCQKTIEEISLFSKNEQNCKSQIKDEINSDKVNNKY